MEYFKINQYFDYVVGAELHGGRNEKLDVIKYAIDIASIESMETAVMIGDRKFDIEAANQVGMESIGVLFGFGSEEELQKAGATHIISTPSEIAQLIL